MHLSVPLLALSLVYTVFLTILFIRKRTIKNIETSIFSFQLFITLLGIVVDIAGIWAHLQLPETSIIRAAIVRIYLIFLISFCGIISMYVYAISKGKGTFKKIGDLIKTKKIFTLIYCIIVILSLVLPFHYYKDDIAVYVYGPACNLVYGSAGVYLIYWIYLIIVNRKTIDRKKILPILTFVIFSIPVIIFQRNNPEYLLVTVLTAFITFFMYHTIENPDLEIIEQLEKARDEANRANKAKSEFLSSMSHEIRTPLNAIIGFSEFILDSDSIEDAHNTAKDVVSASQTLLETVNGILDISKVESGKLEIIEDNYNLKELLDNTVRMAKARMGDKQLDLRVHFAPDLPDTLYGDKNNLNKVIINLLTNAIKYTKEGYIDYTVQCAKTTEICRLIITVKDTGIGIKKENIDKLFTRFQRFDEKSNGTIEGTGLGLAITKQLVEMMGGNIVVSSIYGEGSNFTVALDQRISLAHVAREDIQTDEYRFDLHDKKILVVDDNNLNLKLAERIFLKYNCKVQCVTSGFECLDYINKGYTYDLVLLDDVMPKMLGSETLTRLKRIENFKTPVIALTANAIAGMKEKYLLLGFDDYLAKPIEKDQLEIILKKFLLDKKEAKSLSDDVLTSSRPMSVISDETKNDILSSASSKNTVVVTKEQAASEPATQAQAAKPEEKSQVEGIKFNDKGANAEIVIPENEQFTDYSDKRILVVDDNKLNLKVALKFLSRYKFQEDEAYSGEECLEKIKNGEKYDIIFMDIMMPNLNGVETFHELQKIEGFNIPVVIALTADAVEGAKEKYLKEGFAEYISKPIVRERLDKVIHKVLDKQEQSED